jgi:hypothetical protein
LPLAQLQLQKGELVTGTSVYLGPFSRILINLSVFEKLMRIVTFDRDIQLKWEIILENYIKFMEESVIVGFY